MLLASLIISIITCILVGLAAHAPWFIGVTMANANTMNVGMLLSDYDGSESFSPVFPGVWCDSATGSSCSDYEILSIVMYIIYALSFFWQIVAIICTIFHSHWGIFILGASLTFQCVGLFGFFFRVIGLQLAVAAAKHSSTVSEWNFGWPSILGAVGVIVTFVNILVYAFTWCPLPPLPPPVDDQDPNDPNNYNQQQQQQQPYDPNQQQQQQGQGQGQQLQQQPSQGQFNNNNNNNLQQQPSQSQYQQQPPAQQPQQNHQQQPPPPGNNQQQVHKKMMSAPQ